MKSFLTKTIIFVALFATALSITACGNKQNNNDKVKNTVRETHYKSGSTLFSTEYDVEDYCEGVFVVSKSDGLLYGLLDMKGNEILPVKYDNIEMLNKEEYLLGKNDALYLKTKYEDQYSVIDVSGKEIINDNVNVVKYIFNNTRSVFFEKSDTTRKSIIIYDEQGNQILKMGEDNQEFIYNYEPVSENCYILSTMKSTMTSTSSANVEYIKTELYHNNQLIKGWDLTGLLNKQRINDTLVFALCASNGQGEICTIDKDGNILSEEEINGNDIQSYFVDLAKKDLLQRQGQGEKNQLDTDEVTLYKSNGTWKLEDSSGNPIYNERYYKAQTISQKANHCYLLYNEDDECCLVNRHGKILVDYGVIRLNDSSFTVNGQETSNELYEGVNSVCFAIKNENNSLWDIYYYDKK